VCNERKTVAAVRALGTRRPRRLVVGRGGTIDHARSGSICFKEDSVLTVGESERFVQEGGMIGFLLEDNKIRFEINLDAAVHARLKVSSRLLAIAKTVIGGHRGS